MTQAIRRLFFPQPVWANAARSVWREGWEPTGYVYGHDVTISTIRGTTTSEVRHQ